MLSVRLPPELEQQLDFVSLASGIPKNTIVQQVLAKFLMHDELGRLPLSEHLVEPNDPIIRERQFDRFNERLKIEREHISRIIGWVAEHQIWTKNLANTSGDVTPGSYGRNLVVGFNARFNESETLVISKNLPTYSHLGAPSYHYDITGFNDWLKHMRPVSMQ
jgi:hypothetical protein